MNSSSSSILRSLVVGIVVLLAGVLFLATPRVVLADACTTTLTATSDWMVDTNWTCNHVPTAEDSVIINRSMVFDTSIESNSTVTSLTINGGATFTIGNGVTNRTITITDFLLLYGGTLTNSNGSHTISLGGDFTNSGTFNEGTSNIQFNANTEIDGTSDTTFYDIEINGALTSADPILNTNIKIKHNFTNHGIFNHNDGIISFTGSGNQIISGPTVFNNLIIVNSCTTPNDGCQVTTQSLITVEGYLDVISGQFSPSTNSTFQHVSISSGGFFVPKLSATINVKGHWTRNGVFSSNNGTVKFNGSVQDITGETTFTNLTISPSAPEGQQAYVRALSAIYVENNLNISGLFRPFTGSSFFNVNINSITLQPENEASIYVKGNWSNKASFAANSGTVIFQGSGAQSIGGTADSNFNNLVINNPNGVSLGFKNTVNNELDLANGRLTLGSNNLILGPNAVVNSIHTPSSINMVVADAYGKMCKLFSKPGSFTYPIGDATDEVEYSPATLTFNSLSGNDEFCVKVTDAKHPANGLTTNFITRYWSVTQADISTSFICDISMTYLPIDVDGVENLLDGQHLKSSGWTKLDHVNITTHLFTGTVTGFSDFTAAKSSPTSINLKNFQTGKAPSGVILSWQTTSETSILGFNLYRREALEDFEQVNDTLIPSQVGGQPQGAVYTYFDDDADLNNRYEYKLEIIETSLQVEGSSLATYWPHSVRLPIVVK